MKLFRASNENGTITIEKTPENINTEIIKDITIIGKKRPTEKEDGFILFCEDIFYFISQTIISELVKTDILQNLVNIVTQIGNSVANSQYINTSGTPTPIITTINADLQPLIEKLNKVVKQL